MTDIKFETHRDLHFGIENLMTRFKGLGLNEEQAMIMTIGVYKLYGITEYYITTHYIHGQSYLISKFRQLNHDSFNGNLISRPSGLSEEMKEVCKRGEVLKFLDELISEKAKDSDNFNTESRLLKKESPAKKAVEATGMSFIELLIVFMIVMVLGATYYKLTRKGDEFVETRIERFEVLHVNPPKHMYVDLRNVQTNQVHKSQHVAKHCSSWKEVTIGSEWNLKVSIYERPDSSRYQVIHTRPLCQS